MAEDEKFLRDNFRMNKQVSHESDTSDPDEPIRLDLGIDPSRNFEKISETEGAVAGPSAEVHRREENPFSFKHFLRSTTNYQSQGARPKVYCDGRPIASISDLEINNSPGIKQTRIVPEFSSGLPDFVQDHLVIEQCYLDKDTSENGFNIGGHNLPDFTPHRNNVNYNRLNGEASRTGGRRTDTDPNNIPLPLDLPVRPLAGFPLDLPITENNPTGSRSCPASVEVASSKSLPDFLNDGAARTQGNDEVLPEASIESMDSLRLSVDLYRQQLADQIHCTEQLRYQLDVARNKEQEYTQNLTKALGHVEENLERSNYRAAAAEDTIIVLKQEIKALKSKTKLLQQENDKLLREQGAAGGPSTSQFVFNETHSRRLAHDLRLSANSAEQSLRQLLLGVENLRMIASTIENSNRIEDRLEESSDVEDNHGPVL